MTEAQPRHTPRVTALWHFLKTPKGLVLIALALLLALAVPVAGFQRAGPGLIAAAVASMGFDALVLRWRSGRWAFPSGALLTALIVAMVLGSEEPWWITTLTSLAGVASKYIFRSRTANVFNPAAFGIIATFYVFGTAQSWWGALPDLPLAAIAVLFATGIYVAYRVNKLPMVIVFLGLYYLAFTLLAWTSDPREVAEIFRPPDLHAVLFFAFFMLTDPPTAPTRNGDQMIYAAIVAAFSVAAFAVVGVVYYLLAGLLAGNVWEAHRRWRARRSKTRPAAAAVAAISSC